MLLILHMFTAFICAILGTLALTILFLFRVLHLMFIAHIKICHKCKRSWALSSISSFGDAAVARQMFWVCHL